MFENNTPPDPQTDANDEEGLWEVLFKIVPESGKLPPQQRRTFLGLMRRHLAHEKEDKDQALNIFRADTPEPLKTLIASLPLFTEEQIQEQVTGWLLPLEEAESEVAHWSMRHQSAKGQMLILESLVDFQMIRLDEFTYLLISSENHDEMIQAFSTAFGRPFDVFSEKALFVGDRHWRGWAWFINPDTAAAETAAAQLKTTWKGMQPPPHALG